MQKTRGLHVGEFKFIVKTVDKRNLRECKRMLKAANPKDLLKGESDHADEALSALSGIALVLFSAIGLRIAWLAATQSPGLWFVALMIGFVVWRLWRQRS
jgi:hypothetical protein